MDPRGAAYEHGRAQGGEGGVICPPPPEKNTKHKNPSYKIDFTCFLYIKKLYLSIPLIKFLSTHMSKNSGSIHIVEKVILATKKKWMNENVPLLNLVLRYKLTKIKLIHIPFVIIPDYGPV